MLYFKISAVITLTKLCFKYFSLSFFDRYSSFSIIVRDFGLYLIISLVRAPLPGPISKIFLFFISTNRIILIIIFYL